MGHRELEEIATRYGSTEGAIVKHGEFGSRCRVGVIVLESVGFDEFLY